jgi:NAD(P)-dependent dehydrogenase (short-subunit alcohol dehydrogenase family)
MTFHHNTLSGQVAFITGAGSGIGAATARFLADAGASVALVDYDAESVAKVRAELTAKGQGSIAISASVADVAAMESAYAQTLAEFGRLDIVVANAGINGYWGPIEEFPIEEWDRATNINLRGTFLTVRYAVPHLKERGGSIIITGSVNGTRMFSNTGATAYACTKAAQIAFTKMTALELARHRIRVNVICPGSIDTNIDQSTRPVDLHKIREPVQFPAGVVPLKRGEPGTPQDVAQLIWFLASPASSHISGTEIFIDGAQSLLQG